MTKTKVLIWQWGRRGGGPRYTYELARALAADANYALHLSVSRQSEIISEFRGLNLPMHEIDTYTDLLSGALSTLRLPAIRRAFWNYVKKNEIDIVVGTMSHLWNVPMLWGRRSKIPYLMVLHDALPHRGDDVPLRAMLLKHEISCTNGVVALTEHVRRILCEDYGYAKERSWVVPHGIFPYGAAEQKQKPSRFSLLFFGRIMPYKGLDLLLTAFALLRAQGRDVELRIVGSGDLKPYAAQLAALDSAIVDQRWIAEDEIGEIFGSADLVVLPYHAASQSGVIATAYACGLPVVVTPVGGLVEQVKHEETGLVASEASADAFAKAVAWMMDDRALYERCVEGTKNMTQQELSWPAVAAQFSGAMDALLAMEMPTCVAS